MGTNVLKIINLLACALLIAACFFPWISFASNGIVFTGVKTETFPNGIDYGRPGYFMIALAAFIIICNLIPKRIFNRAAILLAAFLMAYGFRTYHLFTSSLFEGEVIKHAGIYLALILPIIILLTTIFSFGSSAKRGH